MGRTNEVNLLERTVHIFFTTVAQAVKEWKIGRLYFSLIRTEQWSTNYNHWADSSLLSVSFGE